MKEKVFEKPQPNLSVEQLKKFTAQAKTTDQLLRDNIADETKSTSDVVNPDLKMSTDGTNVRIEIAEPELVQATWADDVTDFHRQFKIQYDGPPRMLPTQLKYFRHERNTEEARELYHAQNLPESLDAIIDQIYICLGTAHLYGFTPEMLAEAWRRVHEANMKKEISTVDNPGKYGQIGTDIVKPKGWVPPDLSDIVEVKK